MEYDPDRYNRGSIRLKGYDYSQPGFYYVTICTQDRVKRFGEIKEDKMILNDAGEMVDAEWNRIPERHDQVVLDKYQIMPNHMHGILQIISLKNDVQQTIDPGTVGTSLVGVLCEDEKSNVNGINDGDETVENKSKKIDATSARTPIKDVPTLGSIIGGFKSITTTNYAKNVKTNNWPPFRKRLWQLRCHDHIIRNEEELNGIRKYIAENPKSWKDDENHPENIAK